MSVVAVNSALQRARATMAANRPHGRTGAPPPRPTEAEMELVRRAIAAHEAADVEAMAAMLRDDVRIAMPPAPFWFNGKATFVPGLHAGLTDAGKWRLVPIEANRMPAMASYLLAPGDDTYRAFKIDVVRFEAGMVAEITTFGAALFPEFGLPPTL